MNVAAFATNPLTGAVTGLVGPGGGHTFPIFVANGIAQDMAQNHSTVMAIQSDSTGDTLSWGGTNGVSTTGTWPGLLTAILSQKYPSYRIEWNAWDDATQDYKITQVLNAGAGERGIQCSASGGLRQCSYIDYGFWTSDVDVRVKVSNSVWPPASAGILVANWGSSAPNFGWKLSVRSNGQTQLVYDYTLDGTNVLTATSSGFTIASGATYWFRVTAVANNGSAGNAITFYYSTDGVSWTTINSVITGGTVTWAKANTNYEIGSVGVLGGPFSGVIYKAEIRDGVNGPRITPVNIESWRAYNSTDQSQYVGAPTLFVFCGSQSGQAIAYFNETTRIKKMLPKITRGQVFLSTGHNESMQATTETDVINWFTSAKARVRYALISVIMQNPDISPSSRVMHQAEFVQMIGYIAKNVGLGTIDVSRSFLSAGPSAYTNTDGVHPNQAGYQLWANTVYSQAIGE